MNIDPEKLIEVYLPVAIVIIFFAAVFVQKVVLRKPFGPGQVDRWFDIAVMGALLLVTIIFLALFLAERG
jgi:hypothetical protein